MIFVTSQDLAANCSLRNVRVMAVTAAEDDDDDDDDKEAVTVTVVYTAAEPSPRKGTHCSDGVWFSPGCAIAVRCRVPKLYVLPLLSFV